MTTKTKAEPTITASSARRRLADTLYREAQENDPSLCQTHNNTFRNFVSHILSRGGDQQQQQQKKEPLEESPTSSSTAAAAAASSASNSSGGGAVQVRHGGGAFTDDASRFSHRCDEARVAAAAEARRIVDEALNARTANPQHDHLHHHHHQFPDDVQDKNSVLLLCEWRAICRQHPGLLKTTLERAMPRSETTATALVHDTPLAIIPARSQDDGGGGKPQKSSSSSASSGDSKKRRQGEEGGARSSDEEDEEDTNNNNNNNNNNKHDQDGQQLGKSSKSSSSTSSEASSSSSSSSSSSGGGSPTTLSEAVIGAWTYATDWGQRLHQWLERFVAGGIAGGVAKTVIAPGDRVKIIFQVNSKMIFSVAAAFGLAHQIVKRNGPLGLWAGHGATLLRVVPYASISFASFEFYHLSFRDIILRKDQIAEEEKLKRLKAGSDSHGHGHGGHGHGHAGKEDSGAGSWRHILLRFVCGASAGATATTVTYPLDLLRARYAAHSLNSSGKPYPSYLVGLRHIYKTEGITKLYSGLGPTLIGIVPYAGASFTVFETLKAFVLSQQRKKDRQQQLLDAASSSSSDHKKSTSSSSNKKHHSGELATWQRLIAGALSGLVAQTLTYPLDIVRRRMQVHPEKSISMAHVLTQIYKEEGVRRGLYKGLTMNWIKGPIAVGVSFTINDYIKSRTQRYHAAAALRMEEDEDEFEEFANSGQQQQQQQQPPPPQAAAVSGKAEAKATKKKTISSTEAAVHYLHISERLACGAVAGFAAKVWMIPFERMKLLMAMELHNQEAAANHSSSSALRGVKYSPRSMLRLFFNTPNPWQGTAGMLLRVTPFAALSYTVFDSVQPFARRLVLTKEASFASDMIAGSIGAAIATAVCHPMDVLRQRVALAESPPFASYVQGLKSGSLSSLYVGLRPALVGVCPLAAFGFAFYHEGKRRFDDGSLSMRLALGAGAGIVGQVVSYPFNLVRRHAVRASVASETAAAAAASASAAGATASSTAAASATSASTAASSSIFASESTMIAAARKEGGAAALRQMYRRMPMGWAFSTATFATSFALHDWMRDQLIALRRRQSRDLLLKDPTA